MQLKAEGCPTSKTTVRDVSRAFPKPKGAPIKGVTESRPAERFALGGVEDVWPY